MTRRAAVRALSRIARALCAAALLAQLCGCTLWIDQDAGTSMDASTSTDSGH